MRTLWDILPSVARGTEQGKIKWESSDPKGWSFTTTLDTKYQLAVLFVTDEDSGIREVKLQLNDAEKVLLDEAKANEFDPKYPSLEKLFYAARRTATNAIDVIGEVEKVLLRLQAS